MTLESAAGFASWDAPKLSSIIRDRILTRGNWMIIWGTEDTWKSWFVLDLAWSVAEGNPWLIFPTTQTRVLIINNELHKTLYQERWRTMIRTRKSCPAELFVMTDLSMKLDSQEGLSKLVSWVAQCKPGLIIIDNLYRTFTGNISSGEHVNVFLDTLSYIREHYGCSFVFVHHSRKTTYDLIRRQVVRRGIEDMYGSKFLANNVSTVFETRRVNLEGGKEGVVLIPEKMWFVKPEDQPLSMAFEFTDETQFRLATLAERGT